MKILHVTTFLQGGAGRIIASLAIAQRRAGHEVIVVGDAGRHAGYETYPEYITDLEANQVEYHTVTSTITRDNALNVRAVAEITDRLAGRLLDVVHTHAAIPTLVARLARDRSSRTPVVQTMHGWGIHKTPEQAATDITLLGLADAVVTPSIAARDTLYALGLRASIRVIPYGLAERVSDARPDADVAALFERVRAAGSTIALCIGTVGERKNQALLIRALPLVDDTTAIFIGDGDARPLRILADDLGVTARVNVLGHLPDASRYLPLADALVLPSMNEGLPIVVLEALRAGVPVVGSAIPEIAEAVDEGRTGFLFVPGDAAGLSTALRKAAAAADNASMRMHARQRFETHYRAERMLADYDRLYADVRDA
jgi:glycosyltransferase involved in cell wall biosynthesis